MVLAILLLVIAFLQGIVCIANIARGKVLETLLSAGFVVVEVLAAIALM